jgi:glucokinase
MRPPNLPGWDAVPLRDQLASTFGCPVLVENDANAAAWGEFCHGAGRRTAHMVYLTVSTGIGGGLVLDGRLYRGAGGAAGEIGHIPLLPDGPPCGCGARGCLEALASGSAIARAAREARVQDRARGLSDATAADAITAEHVHSAALAGDPDCRHIIVEAGHFLGLGLTAIANLFDPEVIVLGGGVMRTGAMLLDPAVAVLRERAMPPARDHVRVALAALGDRAGVLGVAALARERPGRLA